LLALVVQAAPGPAAAQADAGAPSPERGRKLYQSYCARCHGVNMVNVGGAAFDLRTLTAEERERFERSVTQGVRAMPAWGGILQPADIQALWSYVMAGR
jgi:mono/diheme cytochrome c family protein